MTESAFLDKGVLLGFCFLTDTHHSKCRKYLLTEGTDHYATEEVEKAFSRNKSRIEKDHRKEILHHVKKLGDSKYTGELGPGELKEVKERLVSRGNKAWRYLESYYESKNLVSVGEIDAELRNLTRDIEGRANDRMAKFGDIVLRWERKEEHEDVQDALSEIRSHKEEDFWICIDAHDLATNQDGDTELATTDIEDFKENGREGLILESTDLTSINGLAVTTRQR